MCGSCPGHALSSVAAGTALGPGDSAAVRGDQIVAGVA